MKISSNGRYPANGNAKPKIEVTLNFDGQSSEFILRLDDPNQPDFWMELAIPAEMVDKVRFYTLSNIKGRLVPSTLEKG